jgi:hypothetical protein
VCVCVCVCVCGHHHNANIWHTDTVLPRTADVLDIRVESAVHYHELEKDTSQSKRAPLGTHIQPPHKRKSSLPALIQVNLQSSQLTPRDSVANRPCSRYCRYSDGSWFLFRKWHSALTYWHRGIKNLGQIY